MRRMTLSVIRRLAIKLNVQRKSSHAQWHREDSSPGVGIDAFSHACEKAICVATRHRISKQYVWLFQGSGFQHSLALEMLRPQRSTK